jgi:hypothetical protein
MLRSFLKGLNKDVNPNEFFEYCIANWNEVNREVSRDHGRPRMKSNPTMQEILFMKHDLLDIYSKNGKNGNGLEVRGGIAYYTKVEDVPKDHPEYQKIIQKIKSGIQVGYRI